MAVMMQETETAAQMAGLMATQAARMLLPRPMLLLRRTHLTTAGKSKQDEVVAMVAAAFTKQEPTARREDALSKAEKQRRCITGNESARS